MISIENAYYSANTEQIHVILYNDDTVNFDFDTDITSISITKVIGAAEYVFQCTGAYTINKFDSDTQAHINIVVDDVLPSGDIDFTADGVYTIEVNTTAGSIGRTIWDETQFYAYKTAIIESESGRNGTVRAAKKIARFSFYEQMLLNAAKQGFNTDAAIYHAELVRMSSYGIPTIRQEACYL